MAYSNNYVSDYNYGSYNSGGAYSNTPVFDQPQAYNQQRGPIFLKNNGTVPVVPSPSSYPAVYNNSVVQLPILWTALSLALGLEIQGEIIRGLPCIKRLNQLFCPTAGNNYPNDRIDVFIDDNKALMRRMYGDFVTPQDTFEGKRSVDFQQSISGRNASFFYNLTPSQTQYSRSRSSRVKRAGNTSGRLDACESSVEVVTPYWAANSAGKIRAVVNTQHFQQAIQQEVCQNTQTQRCQGDCSCEQKYKWHRLLAYDPDDDCRGIFMDWFLFPSCCLCTCEPLPART